MRADSAILVLLLVGCSGSTDDGTDDAQIIPTMCGVAGSPSGTMCLGLSDCGRGSGNFVEPSFCDNCPPRAETHVCEAGICREAVLANIDVNFVVPMATAGAKSFTLTTFNPIMADGGRLTCEALRSSCGFVGNEKLNAGNSRASPFTPGVADPALAYTSRIFADVGTDRIVFLQATSDRQGKGTVMGVGCQENVEVKMDEMALVGLDVTAP